MHSLPYQLEQRRIGRRFSSCNQLLVSRLGQLHGTEALGTCCTSLAFCADDDGAPKLVVGDETSRLQLWRPNYAGGILACAFDTGHTGSILCARFIVGSGGSKLVCCSTDRQVRLVDLRRQATRPFVCHRARVKALASVSPDVFLSASEDGTVRLFDVRLVGGGRAAGAGPDPHSLLVEQRCERAGRSSLRISINSLAVSPLAPHLFATGGGDPFARLYDMRMLRGGGGAGQASATSAAGRPSWVSTFAPHSMCTPGVVGGSSAGFSTLGRVRHITGVAFAAGGQHLTLSYSGDAIYSMDVRQHGMSFEQLEGRLRQHLSAAATACGDGGSPASVTPTLTRAPAAWEYFTPPRRLEPWQGGSLRAVRTTADGTADGAVAAGLRDRDVLPDQASNSSSGDDDGAAAAVATAGQPLSRQRGVGGGQGGMRGMTIGLGSDSWRRQAAPSLPSPGLLLQPPRLRLRPPPGGLSQSPAAAPAATAPVAAESPPGHLERTLLSLPLPGGTMTIAAGGAGAAVAGSGAGGAAEAGGGAGSEAGSQAAAAAADASSHDSPPPRPQRLAWYRYTLSPPGGGAAPAATTAASASAAAAGGGGGEAGNAAAAAPAARGGGRATDAAEGQLGAERSTAARDAASATATAALRSRRGARGSGHGGGGAAIVGGGGGGDVAMADADLAQLPRVPPLHVIRQMRQMMPLSSERLAEQRRLLAAAARGGSPPSSSLAAGTSGRADDQPRDAEHHRSRRRRRDSPDARRGSGGGGDGAAAAAGCSERARGLDGPVASPRPAGGAEAEAAVAAPSAVRPGGAATPADRCVRRRRAQDPGGATHTGRTDSGGGSDSDSGSASDAERRPPAGERVRGRGRQPPKRRRVRSGAGTDGDDDVGAAGRHPRDHSLPTVRRPAVSEGATREVEGEMADRENGVADTGAGVAAQMVDPRRQGDGGDGGGSGSPAGAAVSPAAGGVGADTLAASLAVAPPPASPLLAFRIAVPPPSPPASSSDDDRLLLPPASHGSGPTAAGAGPAEANEGAAGGGRETAAGMDPRVGPDGSMTPPAGLSQQRPMPVQQSPPWSLGGAAGGGGEGAAAAAAAESSERGGSARRLSSIVTPCGRQKEGAAATDGEGGFLRCFDGHKNVMTIKEVAWLGGTGYGDRTSYIVSGSDEGHVFIWDYDTAEIVRMLPGHDHVIPTSLAVHPGEPMLATCGNGSVVKLWGPGGSDPRVGGGWSLAGESSDAEAEAGAGAAGGLAGAAELRGEPRLRALAAANRADLRRRRAEAEADPAGRGGRPAGAAWVTFAAAIRERTADVTAATGLLAAAAAASRTADRRGARGTTAAAAAAGRPGSGGGGTAADAGGPRTPPAQGSSPHLAQPGQPSGGLLQPAQPNAQTPTHGSPGRGVLRLSTALERQRRRSGSPEETIPAFGLTPPRGVSGFGGRRRGGVGGGGVDDEDGGEQSEEEGAGGGEAGGGGQRAPDAALSPRVCSIM